MDPTEHRMSQNRGISRQLRAMACLTALAFLGSLLSVLPAQAHSASSSVFYASTPAVENNRLCALGPDPGITPRSETPNPSQMEFHVRFVQDCIAHSTTEMWRTDVRSYTAEHVQVCNYGSHNGSNGSPVSQAATVDGTEHTYKGLPESNGTGTCPGPPNGPSISEIHYYMFKVQWKQNQVWHTIGTAKTTAEFEPPAAPSNPRVTEVTPTSVSLAWDDNSTNEDRFELQRSDDEGTTWSEIAQPAQNDTSHTDSGVLKGVTYQYRVRATNENGASDWSNIATATTACASDTDCDGLSNSDEHDVLGTSPTNPDTDGDGLLDPWEAPSWVDGSGIRPSSFPNHVVSRGEAVGPTAFSTCPTPLWKDSQGRFNGWHTCLNELPDPLHKDVFLELDWQDCGVESSCPHGDPMHHAPDLEGLRSVVEAFAVAPVTNPDGTEGINLRILIDEAVTHEPNCDQDESALRDAHFGTELQRTDPPAVLAAKTMVVRYVWSGHSSYSDLAASCPTPNPFEIGLTALGTRSIEPYDWSPFGDANVGGRDILITLGPVWSCSTRVQPSGIGRPFDADCDREDGFGIYPTEVADGSGGTVDLPWPVARLLGLPESEGITQLWGRAMMRLLGRSLGLDVTIALGNLPDELGIDVNGDGLREILPPDPYLNWSGLAYAPEGIGSPSSEPVPRYDWLISQDSDGDGVVEGLDNCPGISNPQEERVVYGGIAQWQPDNDYDGRGDACDEDIDSDGILNGQAFTGQVRSGPGFDAHPYDTDNDGLHNQRDLDDDGDLLSDLVDNCPFQSNKGQFDFDRDQLGNRCDQDDDADGVPDVMEQ